VTPKIEVPKTPAIWLVKPDHAVAGSLNTSDHPFGVRLDASELPGRPTG